MSLLERLARRQLLVVTGKGGVGKTAIAAALGSLLADTGRRVLLVEVDPRENLHQIFDVPPSGGDIVRLDANLGLQNLRPHAVIEELVRLHLRVDALARRVTANAVFQHFIEGAPGLKELAVLSHAERIVKPRGRKPADFDLVVFDAPATGHGVSLLVAPKLVSEVIQGGPIGAEARNLASLVADADRTGIVTVTHAEELPAQETIELREALVKQVNRTPELLVINALYPPFPIELQAAGFHGGEAGEESSEDGLLLQLWHSRRAVNQREIVRLAKAWPGDTLLVPLLPADRSPRLLAGIRQKMLEQMRQAA